MRLRLLCLFALLAPTAVAQTSPAVTELSRVERKVFLTLRSGPHIYPGDYPITVYLPPGYAETTDRYRVIYLFDGFDFHDAHDTLANEGLIHPAILVAISNKTSTSRNYDLTPVAVDSTSGGLESFTALIAGELKPYIDAHFRTRPEAACTGVIGNSFGGLAACWLGFMHADTFGLAGCLEPSLWWNSNDLLNRIQRTTEKLPTRFWIMAADQEVPMMWQNAKYAAYLLTLRGWREGEDVAFCQVHNYPHGSAGARVQVRDMFHFLLRKAPPVPIRIELTNCHGPQLVPLRPAELGGAAYAYVDVRYLHDLRTTAIAPELQVADSRMVQLSSPVFGQLIPLAGGWTTVSAEFAGFRAVIDVQGTLPGSPADPPARPALPIITEHPESQTAAAGTLLGLSVAAAGSDPLRYQWRRSGELLPGETNTQLRLPAFTATASEDYDVIVTNAQGSTLSRRATLRAAIPVVGRLANLSVRAAIAAGIQPLIVGFSVTGGTKPILIRAIGPTLGSTFNVAGTVANPRLTVFDQIGTGAVLAAQNEDWCDSKGGPESLRVAFSAVGAFPLTDGSGDAAALLEVNGGRTAHVRGADANGGVVLVECYDAAPGNAVRLTNLSVRNWTGGPGQELIAGFVIDGNVPRRLLIRGIGPTLRARFGIEDALPEATVALHGAVDGCDTVIAMNTEWIAEPGAAEAATAVAAFPLAPDCRDAALVLTVPVGAYTVQLGGSPGAVGQGMIEIYELPQRGAGASGPASDR